ncbi:MAG: hypothetical protein DHS20C15_32400 [Planctomycetota bacterium]|nr:MAG: hypothetical protein DHS20C15_32400 [Planctomycetota bacterium]
MPNSVYTWRSSHLLLSLLALVMFHPLALAIPEPWDGRIMNALTTIVMLTAVWWTAEHRRHRWMAVLLVSPASFTQWLRNDIGPWAAVAGVVFYLYLIALLFRRVIRPSTATIDRVFTAISVYLLITVTFSYVHLALYDFDPSAYSFATPPALDPITDMLYFSFVTILSLGYGDIVPVAPFARMVTVTEAFVGAFFVAILIARLVSLGPQADLVGDRPEELDG